MSFLTVVQAAAADIDTAAVADAKSIITYIDNVIVTEIEPALEAALLAGLKVLGQDALAALINAGTPTATPAS